MQKRFEKRLDAEMQFHLDTATQAYIAAGLQPEEAHRRARVDFGALELAKDEMRDLHPFHCIEEIGRDLRYAIRQLRRNPAFTAAAILTLALGIGANTSIFTLAKAILLQPLPVRAANRLVVIWIDNLKAGWSRIGPTGQDYLDWREQSKSFEDLFLFEHGTGTVTGRGEPEQVAGLRVTTNFGSFFAIKPVSGRTFRLDEERMRHNLLILSYGYWQRQFASDPAIVGSGITLNGEQYTIIGVLPPEMSVLFPVDVVVPFDNDWLKRADSDLGVFGRLKPGVTLQQASAEMSVIMGRIAHRRPWRKDYGSVLAPLTSVRVEYIRPALLVLLGAVGFVLLIACANVANLMLSRAVGRSREVAVRTALGAGRARLLRQFLTESTSLVLLAGGAGLLLAVFSTHLLAWYLPSKIPVPNAADQVMLPKAHVDGVALAFTLVLSLATGIVFGLVPAFQNLHRRVNDPLKSGERGSRPGRGAHGIGGALVVVEVALAFVLVIGAGLMVQSFWHLLTAKPGFRPDHLLTLRIKLANDAENSKYRSPWQQAAAFHRFLTAVEGLPGIEYAALTQLVPLSQDDMNMGYFLVKEAPPLPPGEHQAADFRDISSNYFRTMGIPIVQGRPFTDHDNLHSPRVVVIDEALARHFFQNQDPIGKHLQIPNAGQPACEIVGVVAGVRDKGLDQRPHPTIYFPYLQSPDQTMSLVVSIPGKPIAILPAVG